MMAASRSAWVLLALFATAASAQAQIPLPQRWWGMTVLPEGVDPGLTADQFEIRVSTLSSDDEMKDLVKALREGGQMALRNKMFGLMPKGWVKFGKLVGAEVTVMRVTDLPDGRRLLRVFSDHPLRLYDKSDAAGPNQQHPFGYMELFADSAGNVTGTLVAAASLALDDEGLKMESAGVPAIQLKEARTDSPPKR